MSSDRFFTQAANFSSAVSGGVDPRTGLFNVEIALGHLVGNRNLGPSLPLQMSYSPLTWTDSGFGQGVSLGLTTYDTDNRLLVLSTGEQYKTQETSKKVILQQSKLDTVRVTKDENSYRIVHKSGDVEILTGPENASGLKVPTALLTPAGHRLTLKWDFSGPQPRLKEIKDESDTLLTVDYTGGSKATLHVIPGRTEGCDVELRLKNGLLGSVHHFGLGSNAPLVWDFTYSAMGWGSWITGVTMPGGMSETAYYRSDGHRFPQSAKLPALPYVDRLVQAPGGGQPAIESSYSYSDTNFVGGHSDVSWDSGRDNLYEVLTSYTYGSTESRVCAGQTTRITRSYNQYHLQTEETTKQNSCSRSVQTDYYAVLSRPFDQQPTQFQLPRKRTVTWTASGRPQRSEVTETSFDTAGNPLSRTEPDGTVTGWAYYPAGGSGPDCPPDPNGFTRFLASVTRTPAQTAFDAPVHRTSYRYAPYTGTPDPRVSTAVLKTEELRYADGELLQRETLTYSTSGAEFGRVTGFVEIEYPSGSSGPSYAATHSFTFSVEQDALAQTHALTTHDRLTTTRSQKRSRFTGRLWSTTDPQANVTTMTYDGLGRLLTRTANPGTPFEARRTHAYAIGGSAPFTVTSTDALGNQLRRTLDGAGRPLQQERRDVDGDGTWYPVRTWNYDARGRPSSISALDHVRGGGRLQLTQTFAYDDWGLLETTGYTDGESHLTRTDPVQRTTTVQQLGKGTPVSGTEVTTRNSRGEPVSVERFDRQGSSAGRRSLERDGWGRLRRESDELGNLTRYDYDTRGRLVRTTLADNTQITRSHAPFSSGELVTGLTVNGTSYGAQNFDGLGRRTATGSGGRSWTYHYADAAAPLPASATSPDQQVSTYQYTPQLGNALARLQAGSVTQQFTYQPVSGLLTGAGEGEGDGDGEGSVTIARDHYPSGLLRTDTTKLSGRPDGTARTSYTVGGREQGYTGVDDTVQQVVRDEYGRISQVTDPAMQVSLHYDDADRVTGWTAGDLASGHTLTTALTLDDFGREVRRTVADSQGTSWTLTQAWRSNDLLSHRKLSRGDTTLREESFTYNSRNQLTGYTCDGTAPPLDDRGNAVTRQMFTYDSYGNVTSGRTDFAGGSDTATYRFADEADPCRLTGILHTHASYPAQTDLHYDAAGRLITDDAGRTLTYDALGRLRSVSSAGSYGYDPLDRLVTQQTGGITSVLSYRREALATVTEGDRHTRLLHLGQACMAQHRDGAEPETRLLGTDGKKTVLASTATGRPDDEYAYTAYGNRPVGATGSALGYNGERVDPALGWSHLGNGYRAYNPAIMRFTTPDSLSPFGAGGINPYAYCAGDPVNRADPSGHLSWQAWLGIGIGIAGLALTAVTAGASIAAAGGVMAALGAASATTLVVGGLGVVSDVTAITSGALEEASPKASSILGYVSMGTGLAGLGEAGVNAARSVSRLTRRTPELAEGFDRVPALRGRSGGGGNSSRTPVPVEYINDARKYYAEKGFESTVTPAGGRIWHSQYATDANDVEKVIEQAVRDRRNITVLSGLHGSEHGGPVWANSGAYTNDVATLDGIIKGNSDASQFVKIVDASRLAASELKTMLGGNTEIVAGFCYSRNAPFIREALQQGPATSFAPGPEFNILDLFS